MELVTLLSILSAKAVAVVVVVVVVVVVGVGKQLQRAQAKSDASDEVRSRHAAKCKGQQWICLGQPHKL